MNRHPVTAAIRTAEAALSDLDAILAKAKPRPAPTFWQRIVARVKAWLA